MRFLLAISGPRNVRLACFRVIASVLLCCIASGAALADTIFEDDFQKGKADLWSGSGKGDMRLTTYANNVSLRLKGDAAAVTRVSTAGYVDVSVSVSFAAQSLEEGEECAAEVSVDGGRQWVQIFSVGDGQDDAVTLHSGGGTVPGLDNAAVVFIGVRVRGDDDSDSCWADNIKVTGRPMASSGRESKRFSLAELVSGSTTQGLRDFSAYGPSGPTLALSKRLEGRIRISAGSAPGFHVFRDRFGDASANAGAAQHLPPFDFEFVQDGDRLLPVSRGPIGGPHANWEWVLEPGRVWEQPGEDGYLRASIPFALQERNANCLHYGALTFAWRPDGATSQAAVQVAGETCAYFSFDLTGFVRVLYEPRSVRARDAVVSAFHAEVVGRMPVFPIGQLARDFAGADPSQFGSALDIDPSDMTAFGFVIDGKHYASGCQTRSGSYPDCDVLPLPSYSTAKSLVAGLASMRLELLAPGSMATRIADVVPECKGETWADVSLSDALNMATGNFGAAGADADEAADVTWSFLRADNHAAKIAQACSAWTRKAKPGTRFAYHTSDTYILGTALNAIWRKQTSASADFYADLLADPVWRPLGLSPDIMSTRRTYDRVAQPFAGYGLTLHRDDVAKLTMFLNDGHGVLNGKPLLDERMLKSAMQRDPANRGVPAGDPAFRYRNGFWAWNATSYLHCARETWIPFMSGFGGITIAMFPNNSAYYYYSDGGVFAWGRAAAEANRIRKFC